MRTEDETAQVQAKDARLPDGERCIQLGYWTEEAESLTHLVIDPERAGMASTLAVGHGYRERDSWVMAKEAAEATADVER